MPSSVISDHDYDPHRRALTVTFVTGRRYRYDNVPPDIADRLDRADSKGRYFNAAIRDLYPFVESPSAG